MNFMIFISMFPLIFKKNFTRACLNKYLFIWILKLIFSFLDDPNSIRVCNLVSRSDFLGYGFSLRKNEVGPHQIANVELNSPALLSGLQDDDYLLKINDINVVGERYSKTVTRIKNESDKGILKLEVVETTKISKYVRETRIDTQSGFASVSSVGKLSPIMSSSAKPSKKQRKDSKEIDPAMFSGSVRSVPEYMSITPSTSKRPSSASPSIVNYSLFNLEFNLSYLFRQRI